MDQSGKQYQSGGLVFKDTFINENKVAATQAVNDGNYDYIDDGDDDHFDDEDNDVVSDTGG